MPSSANWPISSQDIDRQIELLGALDADSVGFRLLDEVQYPDAPE